MIVVRALRTSMIMMVVAAFMLAASTLAAITVSQNVSSSGTIVTSSNIGVYSDASCTNALTSINWGSIAAGGVSTQMVYIKNTGTGTMTLNMTTSNWNPSGASAYITLTWNREAANLSSGQSTAATLSLTVSSGITGVTSFSNTITFSGTG